MNRAIDVAKYAVTRCMSSDHPISNLHLQKILYYVQKSYLSRGEMAFSDDFEAWRFGPVIPDVYFYFCGYGAMPITAKFEQVISEIDCEKINGIVDEKCELDPWDLVADTHKNDGAWNKIFRNGIGNKQVIPIDLIREVG